MDPIRIIAWGNRGRSDDGVALALAERLEPRFAGDDRVIVQQFHQLGPELVEDLDHCRLVIFVDAHVGDDRGEVCVEPVTPCESPALDTHHCPPSKLLALALALGYRVPEALLVTIHARRLEFGDQLTPGAEQAMIEAEGRIIALLGANGIDAPARGRCDGRTAAVAS